MTVFKSFDTHASYLILDILFQKLILHKNYLVM